MPGISMSVTTQSKRLLAEPRQRLLGVARRRPPRSRRPPAGGAPSRGSPASRRPGARARAADACTGRARGRARRYSRCARHGRREHAHRLARGEEGHAFEQTVGGDRAGDRPHQDLLLALRRRPPPAASGWPETTPSSRSWLPRPRAGRRGAPAARRARAGPAEARRSVAAVALDDAAPARSRVARRTDRGRAARAGAARPASSITASPRRATGTSTRERGAAAGLGVEEDLAADPVHRVGHHVEPDAAAGDLGDLLAGREAGREEQAQGLAPCPGAAALAASTRPDAHGPAR